MSRLTLLSSASLIGLLLVACGTEEASATHVREGSKHASTNGEEGDDATSASPSASSSSSSGQPSAPGGTTAGSGTTSPVKQGVATFYAADGTGNCSFPASKDLMVVAPNKARLYDGSAACGECMKVTGKKGSVVVRVVDSCPVDTPGNDCGDTNADLDLSAQAFTAIADPSAGMTNVTFQVVPCNVTGPMQFQFKDGSSQWWTAVQVRNHREPIAKVEYQKDGKWFELSRSDDNFFTADDGVGPHPQGLPLRITSIYGQVVEDTVPIDDSKTLTGQNQLD